MSSSSVASAIAPLRVTIVGGGTDLPEYYLGRGTTVVSCAISLGIEVSLSIRKDGCYSLQENGTLTETESVLSKGDSFTAHLLKQVAPGGADVVVKSVIRPGSGLGGSGAYTVAVLAALHCAKVTPLCCNSLALEAVRLERSLFGPNVGMQDQVTAAYGGLVHINISPDGELAVRQDRNLFEDLSYIFWRNCLIVDSGEQRAANQQLQALSSALRNDSQVVKKMAGQAMKRDLFLDAISKRDAHSLGALWREQWDVKKSLSTSPLNGRVLRIFQIAESNRLLGGKLLGAGRSGAIILLVPHECRQALESNLEEEGFICHRVNLSRDGVRGWPESVGSRTSNGLVK